MATIAAVIICAVTMLLVITAFALNVKESDK